MIPFLFLCYSNGTSIPKESFIREKLSEFGTIISVLMRPSYNTNLKSFVLVEFATVDEAVSCRTAYTTEDESCLKKLKLGDKRLEVNILIGSKVMRPFEANILPSTTSNAYNQSSVGSPDYSSAQLTPTMKGGQIQTPGQLQPGQSFSSMTAQANANYSSKSTNDEIRMIFDQEFIKEKKEKETVHVAVPIGGCVMEAGNSIPQFFEVMSKNPPIAKLRHIESGMHPNEESVQQYIEDNCALFWSGFITKGLKNNVGVDGYFMSGDYQLASEEVFTLRIHNMNVSHKSNVEEVLSRPCLALVVMVPSNATQKARFQEYRSYFRDKKIIGIVNHFKNKILYIFPYYEELKELLGGLKDGLYMVGMVSEIVKKDEIMPKPEPPTNSQETPSASVGQQDASQAGALGQSSQPKTGVIQNELAQKTLVEEVDDLTPAENPAEDVIIEDITAEGDGLSKMDLEDVVLEDIPEILATSPQKSKPQQTIEIEGPVTEDLTEERSIPEIVMQIEEPDDH